jgi:hypothetical protein
LYKFVNGIQEQTEYFKQYQQQQSDKRSMTRLLSMKPEDLTDQDKKYLKLLKKRSITTYHRKFQEMLWELDTYKFIRDHCMTDITLDITFDGDDTSEIPLKVEISNTEQLIELKNFILNKAKTNLTTSTTKWKYNKFKEYIVDDEKKFIKLIKELKLIDNFYKAYKNNIVHIEGQAYTFEELENLYMTTLPKKVLETWEAEERARDIIRDLDS